MPKFDMEIPHSLDVAEVRSRLGRATSKLEADYGAKCTWDGEDRLLVTRKGLQATVSVEPARLRVDLDLGFLLTPMAPSIKSGISKQLTELLK